MQQETEFYAEFVLGDGESLRMVLKLCNSAVLLIMARELYTKLKDSSQNHNH